MKKELSIDSGVLQFVPKGAYYEDAEEQKAAVNLCWKDFLSYDRTLFSLSTLLPGSGYSKGAMSHMLLSNPITNKERSLTVDVLPLDFETQIIKYNLKKESFSRALKNLLMLAGGEGFSRVNNSKTRKLILSFIFERTNQELDNLAVNYKSKLRTLVAHALGKQTLFMILSGHGPTFDKWVGCYNSDCYTVIFHLFNRPTVLLKLENKFPKILQYEKLKNSAKDQDLVKFKSNMDKLPMRTVMGFRNTYKLNIDLSDVYDKSKMSSKETLQMESAVKKSGAKKKEIDYTKYDIYELWKVFYFKVLNNEVDDLDRIMSAIDFVSVRNQTIDIGPATVIFDASRSMEGSVERKFQPFLTSLSILSTLKNVQGVVYVGGKYIKVPVESNDDFKVIIPQNNTYLWKGLLEALKNKPKNIIVISDGYENSVKGMFEHVYDHLKSSDFDFNLIHLNPVFSASASMGSARRITKDTKPLPVSDYKYLETELMMNQMLEQPSVVKKQLIQRFQKLIK